MGGRDDVILNAKLPDDTSTLRLKNPDISWDGPANDGEAGVIHLLEAPTRCYQCNADYNPADELQLGATSRIMIAADDHDAALLLQEGCTPVRCTHIDCLATHQGQLLV